MAANGNTRKNGLPFYHRYPRDFVEGTLGMPFEVKCAYGFVLDLIYMKRGQLPDDPRFIAGMLGVSVRKWNSIRSALMSAGKLAVIDGFLTNDRAIIELESLAKLSEKQAERRRGTSKNSNLEEPRIDQPEPEPDIPSGISPLSPPKEAQDVPSPPAEAQPPPRAKRATSAGKKAGPIPEGWAPDQATALSLKNELDLTPDELRHCFHQMKDHADAKGRHLKDWTAGYRQWVRKAANDGEIGPGSRARKAGGRADDTLDRA